MPGVLLLYLFRDAAIVSEPRILVLISCFGLFGSNKRGFPVPNSPVCWRERGREERGRDHTQSTLTAPNKAQPHSYIMDCHFKKLTDRGRRFALDCWCSFLLSKRVPNYQSVCKAGTAVGRLSCQILPTVQNQISEKHKKSLCIAQWLIQLHSPGRRRGS